VDEGETRERRWKSEESRDRQRGRHDRDGRKWSFLFFLLLLLLPAKLRDIPLPEGLRSRPRHASPLPLLPTLDLGVVGLSISKELRAHRPRRLDDDELAFDVIPAPDLPLAPPPKRAQPRQGERTAHRTQPHRQPPVMWGEIRSELLEERLGRLWVRLGLGFRVGTSAVVQEDAQTAFRQARKT
jgi:hypothetical protein